MEPRLVAARTDPEVGSDPEALGVPPWPCSHATVEGLMVATRFGQVGTVGRPRCTGGARGRARACAGVAGGAGGSARFGGLGFLGFGPWTG